MRKKFILGLAILMCSFVFLSVSGSASHPAAGNKAAAAVDKTVTIKNFQFTPKNVTVKVGSTVTWLNKEGTHTVTADNGSFQSPNLSADKSYSHKFTKAGTYRYYCSFHGGAGGADMSGTVTVTK
ncbi:MAG: cupredoxin family copper-binding protein [Pyrinomonadaceae bacterium]|nr:cupredoxin family copper-binding protein [Pyrinomonadaceae bacterium]